MSALDEGDESVRSGTSSRYSKRNSEQPKNPLSLMEPLAQYFKSKNISIKKDRNGTNTENSPKYFEDKIPESGFVLHRLL